MHAAHGRGVAVRELELQPLGRAELECLLDAVSTLGAPARERVIAAADGNPFLALESARAGAGMKIFIGSENKLFALSGSSVIAAPYRGGDGKVVGVVGVIGPTRLNYARVVPMVDFTAATLARLMG